MNPALTTCLILGFATLVSFFVWFQQRTPNITSNRLLVRAERWDTAEFRNSTGVVYQTVKITTPQRAIQRKIYRDTQGKRQLKPVKLTGDDTRLKANLAVAGIDWDEPLSASNYQQWHDRQHIREDEVTRASLHLLTLTTTTPEGPVEEQSLTVRDDDFHPVRRTIAFRDSGLVEIAEVEFKILPWSAVDASVFEPDSQIEMATSVAGFGRIIPFRLPPAVTAEQLDEAELGARLVLNQLHADSGEQIQISRNAQDIEITGLVDTDERKRQLRSQLRTVPHVSVLIQSLADLKNDSANNNEAVIDSTSVQTQPSSLMTYLLARGRTVTAINNMAGRLFDTALIISQESNAIADLQAHFSSNEQRTAIASATLSALLFSHRQRLQNALKDERQLLDEARGVDNEGNSIPKQTAPTLSFVAARNLTLCKELTATNSPATRSAEAILAEMALSLEELSASAHRVNTHLLGNVAQDGKN